MDILEQYDRQNPEQKQTPQNIYEDMSGDYGPIIRWVMKISGGKIQNERQANTVLITAAVGIIIISVLILMFSGTPQGESREHLFPPGSSALPSGSIR